LIKIFASGTIFPVHVFHSKLAIHNDKALFQPKKVRHCIASPFAIRTQHVSICSQHFFKKKKIDQLAVQIKYTKAFHHYIVRTKYGLPLLPQFSRAFDMALQGIWPHMKQH
jgi:hypothetical protein